MKEFDIIVIGAGAGTKLVTPPSLIGKKVAVFEKETPGGTCLNRGCIPSKMLIYPSELLRIADDSEKYPVHFKERPKADFKMIVQRLNETVKKDSDSIPVAYEKNPNIQYFHKQVRFVSNKVVSDGIESYTAPYIFIVVGTRPQIPNIPGLLDTPYWTSREALQAETLPKSMLCLGAGFISMELGCAYQSYGCDVVGITRGEILRGIDGEVRQELEAHLPFPIHKNVNIESVSYENKMFTVVGKDKTGNTIELSAERLLVATGIKPNTDDLGIEHTKIQLNENGYIQVNDELETDEPGIYSFGDVIGRYFYRHSANFEGEYLFQNLFQTSEKKPIQYPPVPGAVFTHPQIAHVGFTEEELIQKNIPYYKGVNPYSSSAMGMARMSNVGFVKVLVDASTEKVLGAHIIGEEASNLIHQLIFGMSLGAKLNDYLDMIYIHPAIAEITRNAFRKVRESKEKQGKKI
ncbi:dihydrolipoyl dehydrogenase [Leptospira sp. 96542]|nr:dihydrolipoyl dehydrogenase [Leptospira sp. 96542]